MTKNLKGYEYNVYSQLSGWIIPQVDNLICDKNYPKENQPFATLTRGKFCSLTLKRANDTLWYSTFDMSTAQYRGTFWMSNLKKTELVSEANYCERQLRPWEGQSHCESPTSSVPNSVLQCTINLPIFQIWLERSFTDLHKGITGKLLAVNKYIRENMYIG